MSCGQIGLKCLGGTGVAFRKLILLRYRNLLRCNAWRTAAPVRQLLMFNCWPAFCLSPPHGTTAQAALAHYDDLLMVLAPYLHGERYSSYGRHFTSHKLLHDVAERWVHGWQAGWVRRPSSWVGLQGWEDG